MINNKKQRLEARLKAIKEIKSEYYVGTQEAYETLLELEKIEKNPLETAKRINTQLNADFNGEPCYRATPQRVSGLLEIVRQSREYADLRTEELDFLDNEIFLPEIYLPNNFKELGILELGLDVAENPEKLKSILLPYFRYVNISGFVSGSATNTYFGLGSSELLRMSYVKAREEFSRRLDAKSVGIFDRWIAYTIVKMMIVDWQKVFSTESYNKKISDLREIAIMSGLKNNLIFERLKRDIIDHRLEYRRALVCQWLANRCITDYDEAVSIADNNVIEREERFKKLQEERLPINLIENEMKNIEHIKFIRHCIGSEKNFLKKYLEN